MYIKTPIYELLQSLSITEGTCLERSETINLMMPARSIKEIWKLNCLNNKQNEIIVWLNLEEYISPLRKTPTYNIYFGYGDCEYQAKFNMKLVALECEIKMDIVSLLASLKIKFNPNTINSFLM